MKKKLGDEAEVVQCPFNKDRNFYWNLLFQAFLKLNMLKLSDDKITCTTQFFSCLYQSQTRYVFQPHKVKTQYVHILKFSIFWDIRHFAQTAFLLCQTIKLYHMYFWTNKGCLCLSIIILIKISFNLSKSFYRAVNVIVLLMHFAQTVFCKSTC